jgi:hypothetical protein
MHHNLPILDTNKCCILVRVRVDQVSLLLPSPSIVSGESRELQGVLYNSTTRREDARVEASIDWVRG